MVQWGIPSAGVETCMNGGEEEVKRDAPKGQAGELAELAVIGISQAMSSLPTEYEKDRREGIDRDESPQDGEIHRREQP